MSQNKTFPELLREARANQNMSLPSAGDGVRRPSIDGVPTTSNADVPADYPAPQRPTVDNISTMTVPNDRSTGRLEGYLTAALVEVMTNPEAVLEYYSPPENEGICDRFTTAEQGIEADLVRYRINLADGQLESKRYFSRDEAYHLLLEWLARDAPLAHRKYFHDLDRMRCLSQGELE